MKSEVEETTIDGVNALELAFKSLLESQQRIAVALARGRI
jgi:hypothetical protein